MRLASNACKLNTFFPKICINCISMPAVSISEMMHYTLPLGCIVAYAGETAPKGWLICDGSAVTATNYPDLAAMLGKTGTFALPNLTNAFLRGAAAADVYTSNGADTVTLTSAHIPSHTHSVSLTSSTAANHTHSYNVVSVSAVWGGYAVGNAEDPKDSPNHLVGTTGATSGAGGTHSHTVSGNTGGWGAGAPSAISLLPRHYSVVYIIKAYHVDRD